MNPYISERVSILLCEFWIAIVIKEIRLEEEGRGERMRELVETGFSFSRLVPFLSSDQQQQLGGRSLLNQQKVFPSQWHL